MQGKIQGKLVVIEGLDGSGKSTQLDMLKQTLSDVLFITFPDYESNSGKIIKQYLAGEFSSGVGCAESVESSAYSASGFYAVDRYISYKCSFWGSALVNSKNVVSARYTTSNAIYQMAKLPKNKWQEYLDWLYDYEYGKLGIPRQDLTIFLDVPIEVSQELLRKRYAGGNGSKDIHEGDFVYLEKCREAAMYVAQRDGWRIVDCMNGKLLKSPQEINGELSDLIGKALT